MAVFDIETAIEEIRCCIVNEAWKSAHDNINGIPDKNCLQKRILMSAKFEIIKRYVPVGTVKHYELAVCASINVLDFTPLLEDNMHVLVIIQTPIPVILVDLTGDFASGTLSDFIDAIVDEINLIAGWTAVNNSPSISICFAGNNSVNLVGTAISITLAEEWYLKWTAEIARDLGAPDFFFHLGYGAITPKRPVYIDDSIISPAKLYVPNGDFIRNIFPLTRPLTATLLPRNFTGVTIGTQVTDTIDTGLSVEFFNNVDQNTFTLTFDINETAVCPPPATFVSRFIVFCRIDNYNAGTGLLTYTIYNIQRNSTNTGLSGGNSVPAATLAAACGASGYPYGAVGGAAIGLQNWTFVGTGYDWGTVAIYECNLTTGELTYDSSIEIPVGTSTDACYFPDTEKVAVVGFGNSVSGDLQNGAPMCTIDVNTDTVIDFKTTTFAIRFIKFNPVIGIAYGGNNANLFKVDQDLQYDATKNVVVNVGSITFDSQGIPYIAQEQTSQCVVRKMADVPNPAYNIADPPFQILFTAPDFTASAPPAVNANLDGVTAGQTNLTLLTTAGLDGLGLGGINLIWVNPVQFAIYHDDIPSNKRYIITGRITTRGYINDPTQVLLAPDAPGLVYFDVITVTETIPIGFSNPPFNVTTNTTIPVLGMVVWNWRFYPNITGAIDTFFHQGTGRLYITRATSVGALLQSYDVTSSVVPANIIASKINHYSPGYPNVILNGQINYCSGNIDGVSPGADVMIIVVQGGATSYVFYPQTQTWGNVISHPAIGGTTETGGMNSFSYTGDDSNAGSPSVSSYNFFSSTPSGSELGVVSFLPEQQSQIFGVFDGEAEAVTQTAADNCTDQEELIKKSIQQIKEHCGCVECGNDVIDINSQPSGSGGTVMAIFYGRSTDGALNAAGVQALTSISKQNFAGTYNYVALADNYIYFAAPQSFGIPTQFKDLIGGFDVVMNTVYTVTILGITYNVWRSFNKIAGAQSMQVIQ